MMLSQQDRAGIAARAGSLFDRLQAPHPYRGDFNPEVAEKRMAAWREATSGPTPKLFEERLRLDGLSEDQIRRILGSQADPAVLFGDHLPTWINTLAEMLEAAASNQAGEASIQSTGSIFDSEDMIPFEEALAPFVFLTADKVWKNTGLPCNLLSESSEKALQRQLLRRLSDLCSPVLGLKFTVFKACHSSGIDDWLAGLLEQSSRHQYLAFTAEMRKSGWLETFQGYPVLARMAATVVDFWVGSTSEFLQRLAADRKALGEAFFGGRDPGNVVELRPGLSDHHHQGRTVISVVFESGLKVVYKPRNLGLEMTFGNLLGWLNERGARLNFRVVKVLCRPAYGWAEFVERRACQTEEEAKRFYIRAGMLLGLLHSLEATDCHTDNLIADGEFPVLVDMETLMHQKPRDLSGSPYSAAETDAWKQLSNSVINVGILPRWEVTQQGRAYDISALGGMSYEAEGRTTWIHVNSDRMVARVVRQKIETGRSVPFLYDKALSPGDFSSEIIEGFKSLRRLLVSNREALVAPDGPLAAFAGQPVRYILRATRIYSALLRKLTAPKFLEDGLDRSIELDSLCRAFLINEERPFWPITKPEREALEVMDVPYFSSPTDSDSLPLGESGMMTGCFDGACFDRVMARLGSLDESDLETQVELIQGSLLGHRSEAEGQERSTSVAPLSAEGTEPARNETLIEHAVQIAERLHAKAIRSPAGDAIWIAPTLMPLSGKHQFEPLGYDLYSGSAGIGLFLAALESVTGGAGFRDLALGAFGPLRATFNENPAARRKFVRNGGIGAGFGIGSLIYVLAHAAKWLGEESLLHDARRLAEEINDETIKADHTLDVLGGSAGGILGLLAIHKQLDDPSLLERAVRCGQHLCNKRVVINSSASAWTTSGENEKPLTGFSHGAAGISYALLRLYAATGENTFQQAAREGIAYENSAFVSGVGNWLDFRSSTDDSVQPVRRFMTTWCHGAPGIGLARLGGLPWLDTPDIRTDIETALKTTSDFGLGGIDDLCCGKVGRLELWITGAARLGKPEYLDKARRQTAAIMKNAARSGDYQYNSSALRSVYRPSFFTGETGIGYQFLRVAHPERFPSVLLWE